MISLLIEALQYDKWANEVWVKVIRPTAGLELVQRAPPWHDFPTDDPDARAKDVMLHIYFAQLTWLKRCGGSANLAGLGAEEIGSTLFDAWIAELPKHDLGEVIHYRNGAGEALSQTFAYIVFHLIRHGAYHRGQLREIFELLSPGNIPQT